MKKTTTFQLLLVLASTIVRESIGTSCKFTDGGKDASWKLSKDYCYFYKDEAHKWQDARSSCEKLVANLASIHSEEENNFIADMVTPGTLAAQTPSEDKSSAWLGVIVNTIILEWSDGTPFNYTHWPTDYSTPNASNYCGLMDTSSGYWDSISCDSQIGFVCKRPAAGQNECKNGYVPPPPDVDHSNPCPITERMYYYLHGCYCYGEFYWAYPSWYEAEQYCNFYEGHLVSLSSKDDIGKISGMFSPAPIWVGLHDPDFTGDYQWTDGTKYVSNMWGDDQPDDRQHTANCTFLDNTNYEGKNNGLFLSNCLVHLKFVCKVEASNSPINGDPPMSDDDEQCLIEGLGSEVNWYKLNNYCYYFYNASSSANFKTWREARSQCLSYGADLVSIHDPNVNNFLLDELGVKGVEYNYFWTGLQTTEGEDPYWCDGSDAQYFNWNTGQPDNEQGMESCVAMSDKDGLWSDYHCGTSYGYICMRTENGMTPTLKPPIPPGNCLPGWAQLGTQKCFLLMGYDKNQTKSKQRKWDKARAFCEAEKGKNPQMASVHSAAEMNFLRNVLLSADIDENVWIGLHSYATDSRNYYKWTDETKFDYGYLKGYNLKDCGTMSVSDDHYFTLDCDNSAPFLCSMDADPAIKSKAPSVMRNCTAHYNGYVEYDSDNCFKVHEQPQSFQGAVDTCQKEGGQLVAVDNSNINVFVDGISAEHACDFVWLGLKRSEESESVSWVNGWPVYYTNWGNHGIDEATTGEDCVSMSVNNSDWNVEKCENEHPFICLISSSFPPTLPPSSGSCPSSEWTDLGGPLCYQSFSLQQSSSEAVMGCTTVSGDLVSINSAEENEVILKFSDQISQGRPWIGLIWSEKNGWIWTDHAPLNYEHWAVGFPPNYTYEQCGYMQKSGMWATKGCWLTAPYVCSIEKVSGGLLTTPSSSREGSGLSPGGVAGVVITVLIVMAAIVVGTLYYKRNVSNATSSSLAHERLTM